MKNFRTKNQLLEQINDLKALKSYASKHPANKLRPNFIPGLNEMIKEVKKGKATMVLITGGEIYK